MDDEKNFKDDEIFKAVAEAYDKISQVITQEIRENCTKIIEQFIKNVTAFIAQYLDVHDKIYLANETYRDFIDTAFNEKNIKNLRDIGISRKNMKEMNNFRSLGLSFLWRKLFKIDNKSAEKKYTEYLNDMSPLMEAITTCNKVKELDLVTYFLTLLEIKQIEIETLENMDINEILK